MRLVFVDLETGGLEPKQHPIIQIAAVAVDEELAELAHFERKLDFDADTAEKEALDLGCYSREEWDRSSVTPYDAMCDLAAFLKRYPDVRMMSQRTGRPYFVAQLAGYNAATFDGPFLQTAYRAHDLFMPASYRVLCCLQRALWHFHERDDLTPPADFKLATVCKYFAVPLENAHDALADCRATVQLYRALTNLPTAA